MMRRRSMPGIRTWLARRYVYLAVTARRSLRAVMALRWARTGACRRFRRSGPKFTRCSAHACQWKRTPRRVRVRPGL